MSIPHNFTFDELQHKKAQRIGCGGCFVITYIDYLRPVRVVDKKIIHDMAEIKTDSDIAQMIKRWKQVQCLYPFVARLDTWQYIELFIHARDLRPPNKDPCCVKFKNSFHQH